MEENFRSKLGFTIFILLVVFLAVGGYFFTDYLINEKEIKAKEKENEKINYKIDTTKDYIYYENESTISKDAEIDYKDVVINLNTQTVLNESLRKENQIYKHNIDYISNHEGLNKDLYTYDNDNIYSLTFRTYENYEYDKYVSLLIKDYDYSCFDYINYNKTKAYVFNTETGKELKESEILDIYDLDMNNIKEQIRKYLEGKQTKEDGVEVLKIDETINELSDYSLYINNYGRLCISYLVKTTQINYNEDMEVLR